MSQSRGAAKNSCKLRALDTNKNERLDGRHRRTSADARPTSSRIDAAAQKVMPGETSGDADEDHVDRHRFSVLRKSCFSYLQSTPLIVVLHHQPKLSYDI